MAGKGILDLRAPTSKRNPARTAKLETKAAAMREDKKRARLLRRACEDQRAPASRRPEILALADRLEGAEVPRSRASMRFMREVRRRFAGELYRLHEEHDGSTFTLIPDAHTFSVEKLGTAKLPQRLERLRLAITRTAGSERDGFLFMATDVEYNPGENAQRPGCFNLHFHGYAAGSALDAVDRLRNSYGPLSPKSGAEASKCRVLIAREELHDLPVPFTYLLKSSFFSRDRQLTNPPHRRIEDLEANARLYTWLDKWTVQDTVMMMNLRIINGRLTVRDAGSRPLMI